MHKGHSKRLKQALAGIEDEIIEDDLESVFVFNDSGGEVFWKQGGKYSVKFSDGEISAMRDRIVTHNHPGDGSFSQSDFTLAGKANLREIRAVGITSDGQDRKFRMTRPESGWPNFVRMHTAYGTHQDRLLARDYGHLSYSEMGPEMLARVSVESQHTAMKLMSQQFGVGYSWTGDEPPLVGGLGD